MKTKQIIYTVLIFIFSVNLIGAQEYYKVPKLTVEQKYNNIRGQLDAMVLVGINFAKSKGLSVKEYGAFAGEQFKHSWKIELGFKGLVKPTLHNLSCFLQDPIEIIENKADKVKIKSKKLSPWIEKNKKVYGVTYKEYMDFFSAAMNVIANHLGCEYEVSYDEQWMYTTIIKK